MVAFNPPLSRVMTDETVAETMFTGTPGFVETLGSQTLGGIMDTYLAGPTIREFMTPDLAREPWDPETTWLGSTPAGGRPSTREEAAAKGEKLYATEEEYKASPHYREKVPFEPGMTERRARALAGHTDLAAVREYFGSKRPYTAFAGRLIGQVFDPLNYIPIFGEYTAAAGVARVGARALTMSADAAINTALAGMATRDMRAKLGYDTSWETFAQDIGFAALAGTVIGGGIGAYKGWRARTAVLPETPAVAVTQTPAVGPVAPAPEPRPSPEPGREPIPARAAEETPLARPSIPETAANRTKAAIVVNEALDGLVNDGEVKLGPNAQAIIEEAQARAAAQGAPVAKPTTGLQNIGQAGKAIAAGMYDALWAKVAAGDVTEMGKPSALLQAAKMARDRGGLQTRREFERFANEYGLIVRGLSFQIGMRRLVERYGQRATGPADIPVPGPRATDFSSAPPEPITRPLNFSSPPKPPPDPEIAKAETRVKSVQGDDPVKAETKAHEDSGIDIETGKHDLEPEIAQLKTRGFFDEHEEMREMMEAEDANFKDAVAWGEALEEARLCKR